MRTQERMLEALEDREPLRAVDRLLTDEYEGIDDPEAEDRRAQVFTILDDADLWLTSPIHQSIR